MVHSLYNNHLSSTNFLFLAMKNGGIGGKTLPDTLLEHVLDTAIHYTEHIKQQRSS